MFKCFLFKTPIFASKTNNFKLNVFQMFSGLFTQHHLSSTCFSMVFPWVFHRFSISFPHFSWVFPIFHGFSQFFMGFPWFFHGFCPFFPSKMASPTTATGNDGLAACRSGLAVSALPEATVGAVATGGAAGRGPGRNRSGVGRKCMIDI